MKSCLLPSRVHSTSAEANELPNHLSNVCLITWAKVTARVLAKGGAAAPNCATDGRRQQEGRGGGRCPAVYWQARWNEMGQGSHGIGGYTAWHASAKSLIRFFSRQCSDRAGPLAVGEGHESLLSPQLHIQAWDRLTFMPQSPKSGSCVFRASW